MIYPFIRAKHDYGPRKGTLGLMIHLAEGYNTVSYLANDPRLGNSANYVCEVTGQIVRMLPFDNTSGSLNPADRADNGVYYGHRHLVDVLGDHWTDPNPWVISMEIEGFRATGPNARQVEAVVSWAADMVSRYPTIRGALGHHDQSPKGCPGTTSAMRGLFASIGGHGLWSQEEPVPDLNYGAERWKLDGTTPVTSIGAPRRADGTSDPNVRYVLFSGKAGAPPLTIQPVERSRLTPVSSDLSDELWTALTGYALPGEADVNAALDHVEGPAKAVLTAIQEARPR